MKSISHIVQTGLRQKSSEKKIERQSQAAAQLVLMVGRGQIRGMVVEAEGRPHFHQQSWQTFLHHLLSQR